MTSEEIHKQLDALLKQSIIESLKKIKAENYAEDVFYDALVKKGLTKKREIIKMTYEDLENEVKRYLREKHGEWLKNEIRETKERIEKKKLDKSL